MVILHNLKAAYINQFLQKCSYLFQNNRFFLQYFIPYQYHPKKTIKQRNLRINITKYLLSTQVPDHSICWKCGAKRTKLSDLFCAACEIIQKPVEKENYFKVFEIDEQFSIDEKLLKRKFIKMQNLIHPDKFSNLTHEEQTISEEYSSLINKAHSNLQSPLKRAEHLLKLKGQTIKEGQTVDDPAFLMEVMTLNEEVVDAMDDINKIKMLDTKNRTKMEMLLKNIDDSFRKNDIDDAKRNIIKLKYYTSIGNRINSILREQGVAD